MCTQRRPATVPKRYVVLARSVSLSVERVCFEPGVVSCTFVVFIMFVLREYSLPEPLLVMKRRQWTSRVAWRQFRVKC